MTSSFVDKNGTIPACQHFSMNEKQKKCFNINSYWGSISPQKGRPLFLPPNPDSLNLGCEWLGGWEGGSHGL